MRYLLLLLFVTSTVFSQDFRLPKPDIAQIKAAMEQQPGADNIYIYLTQHFKPVSKKYDIQEYTDTDSPEMCSFRQNFEHNIIYSEDYCSESGVVYNIILPKADIANVKTWVEEMHGKEANYDGIYNLWDETGLIYRPSNEGAGCYYEVKPEKDKTVLFIYCGC